MDANGLANQHAWLVAESERSWALSMTSVSSVAMNTLARSFEVLLQVCRLDPVIDPVSHFIETTLSAIHHSMHDLHTR